MANAFKFRLRTLLEVRRRAEQALARRLAEARAALSLCQKRIEEIEAELAATDRSMRVAREGAKESPSLWIQQGLYRDRLKRLLTESETKADELRGQVEERRLELVEASRKVKALEKLEDRQRRRFEAEIQRKENLEVEEVGQLMYVRRPREEDAPSAV